MLELKVRDGKTDVVLQFEHSLLSLSKWESRTKTPFLTTAPKDTSQLIDYFQDMLLTEIDSSIVYRLSPDQLEDLSKYMNTPQTASSVPKNPSKSGASPETVTSELIYYWMTALEIDWAAESWHLTRLMMLIEITNFKRQPEKKADPKQMYQNWNEINERNKALFGTDG